MKIKLPYLDHSGRLQDVIAAIQVLAIYKRATKKVHDGGRLLDQTH
jgi:hypothetical protein